MRGEGGDCSYCSTNTIFSKKWRTKKRHNKARSYSLTTSLQENIKSFHTSPNGHLEQKHTWEKNCAQIRKERKFVQTLTMGGTHLRQQTEWRAVINSLRICWLKSSQWRPYTRVILLDDSNCSRFHVRCSQFRFVHHLRKRDKKKKQNVYKRTKKYSPRLGVTSLVTYRDFILFASELFCAKSTLFYFTAKYFLAKRYRRTSLVNAKLPWFPRPFTRCI